MKTLNTKLVVTIGPATLDLAIFQELLDIGIDYIRINSAYGDEQQYDLILNNLKNATPKNKVQIIWDIKNLEALDYAKRHGINTIALSFAEHPGQMEKVREIIPSAFIISKIESEKGVDNFDAILDSSDGIMIARGDLASAVSFEKVPPLQKEFTSKTLKKGKFLVTATEMLFSMTLHHHPTRAEVSDVANAVFDCSSAVMLSEETAIGKYPTESVKMMRKIIEEAEMSAYCVRKT
jgi:pyruvate kinase